MRLLDGYKEIGSGWRSKQHGILLENAAILETYRVNIYPELVETFEKIFLRFLVLIMVTYLVFHLAYELWYNFVFVTLFITNKRCYMIRKIQCLLEPLFQYLERNSAYIQNSETNINLQIITIVRLTFFGWIIK